MQNLNYISSLSQLENEAHYLKARLKISITFIMLRGQIRSFIVLAKIKLCFMVWSDTQKNLVSQDCAYSVCVVVDNDTADELKDIKKHSIHASLVAHQNSMLLFWETNCVFMMQMKTDVRFLKNKSRQKRGS